MDTEPTAGASGGGQATLNLLPGTTYFADNPAFFSRTPTGSGTTTDMSSLSGSTGSIFTADTGSSYFSVTWVGYFYAPTTGNYYFTTYSDDASYLWIGTNAKTGYTTANANVKNGSLHGGVSVISSAISLTGGTLYPIRVQYGQNAGGYDFSMSFSGPGISTTSNFSGYVFTSLDTTAYPTIGRS